MGSTYIILLPSFGVFAYFHHQKDSSSLPLWLSNISRIVPPEQAVSDLPSESSETLHNFSVELS